MSKFSAKSFLNAFLLSLCVSVISSAPVATQMNEQSPSSRDESPSPSEVQSDVKIWEDLFNSQPEVRAYLGNLMDCIAVVDQLQLIQKYFYSVDGDEEALALSQITLCQLGMSIAEAAGVNFQLPDSDIGVLANYKRSFDSIGNGPIGLKRSFDGIGNGQIGLKRSFDSIGNGPIGLKRSFDSIGNGPIGLKRSHDSIGFGPIGLKRSFGGIGGRPASYKRNTADNEPELYQEETPKTNMEFPVLSKLREIEAELNQKANSNIKK